LLVIEKAESGHVIVDKLKNTYNYPNPYKYKEYDASGKFKKKAGFQTSTKTKLLIINNFVELFELDELLINSKTLLKEMALFAFKDGKMCASQGHDDTIIATALALHGIKSGIYYV
jgi:hypothetical protein